MTKKELVNEIECLENNIEVYKSRLNISYRRLQKCVKYFESQGLDNKQIIDIMKLEEENI